MFEYSLGQVGAEGLSWGQAYLCVSIAANMDEVPSGSLVYRCVLHIGSGYVCVCVCVEGGGGQGILNTMHVLIFIALIQGKVAGLSINTNDHWLLPALEVRFHLWYIMLVIKCSCFDYRAGT